ncbi:MAG: hypothetical protein IKX56_03535 [Muribaculaceae bacterium]|nr:hypothetical protein [Muribaculaceae bacterium]
MRIRRKKESAIKNFEDFLKGCNCTYDIEKEDNATIIRFEFQAGHFVASFRPQDDCVEVTYPCITSAPLSLLDLVRSKCNERNNSNILFKFSYSINHEQNEVSVHISFFNNSIDPEEIKQELGAAFHFQREWIKDFDNAVDQSKNYETPDLECETYKHEHELFMIRRQELRHQFDDRRHLAAANYAVQQFPLELWKLLEDIAPLPQSTLLFMTVNSASGQQRITDADEIRNFDLRCALIEGQGDQARLVKDYAILDLHYKQGLDEKPMMATISLTAEGDDGITIYTRVNVTLPPRNASRMNSVSNEGRKPRTVSLLIAYDRHDDARRRKECDYMWNDAVLKAKNGDLSNMTQEEVMLSQIQMADVAYNLYWGQKLFHAERYYEALMYLENVYNSYRANFFDMSNENKRSMMEVAYMIGSIYNNFGLHKQAFYYLDLMANDGNIKHTMELVNAMANSKDPRIFSFTDSVMDEVKRNFDKEDELPENIRQFINFLRRRRGYALISFNQLDQAEKLFTRMLDESDNADYAIHELAYIKQLRGISDEVEDSSTSADDDK